MVNRWGQGRIEVLALKNDIEKKIRDGWSIRSIYENLKKEGKLTVDHSTFVRNLRKQGICRAKNQVKIGACEDRQQIYSSTQFKPVEHDPTGADAAARAAFFCEEEG